jgi:CDP-paratose 2-epimerase
VKVLITGICGFVGSSLAEGLLQRRDGISILGIDNLMRPGSELNRARLRELGVMLVHGDLRMASDFESLPAVDWVIDAAANPSVLAGIQQGSSSRQVVEHNLLSVVNALEYCKKHKAGFFLLSSSRVYSIEALTSLPLRTEGNAFRLDGSGDLPPGISSRGIGVDFSTLRRAGRGGAVRHPGPGRILVLDPRARPAPTSALYRVRRNRQTDARCFSSARSHCLG